MAGGSILEFCPEKLGRVGWHKKQVWLMLSILPESGGIYCPAQAALERRKHWVCGGKSPLGRSEVRPGWLKSVSTSQ